jgi:hypothetical protein
MIAVTDITGGKLRFTPVPNGNGTPYATFTFQVQDDGGTLTGGVDLDPTARTMTLNVDAINDVPTMTAISTLGGGHQDTPYTITYAALLAASDAADVDGGVLSFRVEALGSGGGSLTKDGVAVVPGTTLLSVGESLVWTPPAATFGVLEAFTTVVWDGSAASSPAVAVNVGVAEMNHAPTLTTVDTLTGAVEDIDFTISYGMLLAASDAADADGDPISFQIEAVSSGTLTKDGTPVTAGTLFEAGESLVWRGAANANGVLNAFTTTVTDGFAASTTPVQVSVDVTAANDAPTLTTIGAFAGGVEDTPYTISYEELLAASDAGDVEGNPISFRIEEVTSGTLTKDGTPVTTGVTTLSPGESLVWTPAADAHGRLDAFTVVAWDGLAASDTAVPVPVDVAAVNDAPSLTLIDTLSGAAEDTAYTISYDDLLAASDAVDVDGDEISFRIEEITSGTFTKDGTPVTAGLTTLSKGESLVWTPETDANGLLSAFTVVAWDGLATSDAAVPVQVDVTEVNDAPVRLTGSTDDLSVPADAGLTSLGLEGLTYGCGGGADEASQTLTFTVTDLPDADLGQVVLADGTTNVVLGGYTLAEIQGMQFLPNASSAGGTSSFAFSVTDDGTTAGVADPRAIAEALSITVTSVQNATLSIGLFDPAASTFYLRATISTGPADYSFGFGAPGADWTVLEGDWDGNGKTDMGLYDPQSSNFYLTETYTTGTATYSFGYGVPDAGWLPLVGDWDGDGKSGVGLYDPHASTFYLTNDLQGGYAQYAFGFGDTTYANTPLVGDWDGDGRVGVGLYQSETSTFYLTDTLATGYAKHSFAFGTPGAGWQPLVGDWNGDGAAGVGLFDAASSWYYLTNNFADSTAEYQFGYGVPGGGWLSVIGDWDGDGSTGVGFYAPESSTFYLTDSLATGYAEYTVGLGAPNAGWQPLVGTWGTSEKAATVNAQAVDQVDLASVAAEGLADDSALHDVDLVYGPQKPTTSSSATRAIDSALESF